MSTLRSSVAELARALSGKAAFGSMAGFRVSSSYNAFGMAHAIASPRTNQFHWIWPAARKAELCFRCGSAGFG
jgi:hypothetical protein